MSKIEKVAVTFAKRHGPYNVGEVAAFEPARARQLIANGAAVEYDETARQAVEAAAPSHDELNAMRAELAEAKARLAEMEVEKAEAVADAPSDELPTQGKAKAAK